MEKKNFKGVGPYYVAHPDEVETVYIVEIGDGGRNFKAGYRPVEPVVVWSETYAHEWCVSQTRLFVDPVAAAIESERLAREVAND